MTRQVVVWEEDFGGVGELVGIQSEIVKSKGTQL